MPQFKAGNKGRPKGAKNKSKGKAAALVAAALAAPAVLPRGKEGANVPADADPRNVEIAGIDAKAALNNIMREAWLDYCDKRARLLELDVKLDSMRDQLTLILPDPSIDEQQKRDAEWKGRLAIGQEACQQLSTMIKDLRESMNATRSVASSHANMVLPYEHARLQANTNKQVGDIIVRIKEFGAGPKQVKWQKPAAA